MTTTTQYGPDEYPEVTSTAAVVVGAHACRKVRTGEPGVVLTLLLPHWTGELTFSPQDARWLGENLPTLADKAEAFAAAKGDR